jgi:hypothetical protein
MRDLTRACTHYVGLLDNWAASPAPPISQGLTMFPRLQSFFDTHMNCLLQPDLATFVSNYDFPLALYVEGEVIVYASPVQLLEAMAVYRDWLLSKGVCQIQMRINAVDMPRNDRFRVWTTTFYHSATDQVRTRCENIHYLREKRGRYLIEMVHCNETPDADYFWARRAVVQIA